MRRIREMLRRHFACGLGMRQIARSLGVSHSTVSELLHRAAAAGLSWPLPEDLDDAALEALLHPGDPQGRPRRPEPDWAWVHTAKYKPGPPSISMMEGGPAAHRPSPSVEGSGLPRYSTCTPARRRSMAPTFTPPGLAPATTETSPRSAGGTWSKPVRTLDALAAWAASGRVSAAAAQLRPPHVASARARPAAVTTHAVRIGRSPPFLTLKATRQAVRGAFSRKARAPHAA